MSADPRKDTVARFNERAEDYARFRPSYPDTAVDALFEGLGDPAALVAVDVGAGTGISSRLLAGRGAHVIALEPNAEMRALALADGLDVRDGRADATGLPDACADLVTSFQAFHWFANRATVAEFVRLLRSCGRVAVIFNERDDQDPFSFGYGTIVDGFVDRMALAGYENGAELILQLLADGGLQRVRRAAFPNRQTLDYA
ncbi:MAG: class I SAM-dependent methyltransferase, partial [Vulcanimicrobiaceae bacterium]